MISLTRFAPVIVIGMHRSGTSLLTGFLERHGLFIGKSKDKHDESLFFLGLNDWMFKQSAGSWDNPDPLDNLLEDGEIRPLVVDYLRFSLKSVRSISYLGLLKYLRLRDILQLDRPWGWKDPRNTFTLPIWLDVFPEARVLCICRHGVDVAQSLLNRRSRKILPATRRFQRFRTIHQFLPKRSGFTESLVCKSLESSFTLWEKYMEVASKNVSELGDRVFKVKYENILSDPLTYLKNAADFCGLTITDGAMKQSVQKVDASRAFAYRRDPQLVKYAKAIAPRLAAHGY